MVDAKNITAIILAGGKSSRMGTDKGLIDFNGKKMVEYVLEAVKDLCNHIIISGSNSKYKQFGFPVYEDIHKNLGPLGGIHSGLSNSATDWNLIVSCDLSFVTKDFFRFLFSKISNAEAVVPVHDLQVEPLCALYHQSSLPKIESLLLKNELKMQNAVKRLDSIFIKVPKEIFDPATIFKNINSPEDFLSPSHS